MNPIRIDYVSKVDHYKDWYMLHNAGENTDCVVYLHGHGSNGDQLFVRSDFKTRCDLIDQLNMSVISPNLRDNAWMSPAAVEDLKELLSENKEKYKWKRLIFMTGSMGATGALIFAVLHPELVDGLGLLGAACDIGEYRKFCQNQHVYPIHKEIADTITANYTDESAYERHSAIKHAEKLTMPIRFYHGTEDPVMLISEMYQLRDALKDHPDAVFREIPGTHDAPAPFFNEVLLSLAGK